MISSTVEIQNVKCFIILMKIVTYRNSLQFTMVKYYALHIEFLARSNTLIRTLLMTVYLDNSLYDIYSCVLSPEHVQISYGSCVYLCKQADNIHVYRTCAYAISRKLISLNLSIDTCQRHQRSSSNSSQQQQNFIYIFF